MKRERLTIKQKIQKKIELRHENLVFIDKKGENKVKKNDYLRIYGTPTPPAAPIINIGNTFSQPYIKKEIVDYDVVICIPSRDRYEKVKRIINKFYWQPTKYSFKIILLNDGSINSEYDTLINDYPEIIYIKNQTSNGKQRHWYSYNQMWEYLKTTKCHAVLQMDDDFILCRKFLDKILDIYFREKEINNTVLAIAPHTWSFDKISFVNNFGKASIDGIGLFDSEFIKSINYQLNPVSNNGDNGVSAGVWSQIVKILGGNNCCVYRTAESLVWHDGNDDSKLHGDFRKSRPIYTQNFIYKNKHYD